MSNHYSGPDFGYPRGDARLDIADLFAFPKPGDAGKPILIMDVHPSVGANPPGPTTTEFSAFVAIYELKIDTDGDLSVDIAYRVRFSTSGNGAPLATLRRAEGAEAAGSGDGREVIVAGAPVSTGRAAHVTEAGDYRFFAGWRSDPFFFDAEGALHDLQFTGADFFADKDVCSIALEVPHSALGPAAGVRMWCRVLDAVDDAGGGWVQANRGARPAQSVFLPGEARAASLAGEPADDARFVDGFAHVGGYTPQEARRVAETLLPDVLPYDHTRPARYPTNGRALSDDVVDVFLAVFSNGKVTEDGVGPHTDLAPAFPFLAPPHSA